MSEFVARAMALVVGHDPLRDEAVPRTSAGEASPETLGPGPGAAASLSWAPLAGDGSPRRIFRVTRAAVRAVAVANPLPAGRVHPDENEGFLAVREYLHARGVRVPRFYAADLEHGFLLLEDLGDVRLYDLVRAGADPLPLYEEALRSLVRMQMPGEPRFRPEAVANPPYTPEFVLACEARYFHEELVRGLRGVDHAFAEIESECRRLAAEAVSGAPAQTGAEETALGERRPVFLHRDYQSRNLMVTGGGLAVIDFQGAREGPPEYDLAALLYDPYVALAPELREELLRFYLRAPAAARVPGIPRAAEILPPETPDQGAWDRQTRGLARTGPRRAGAARCWPTPRIA